VPRSLSTAAVLCIVLCAVSCGGGSSSTSTPPPTTPTPTPTPPTPTNSWSIAGRVVDSAGQQPVSGVQITPSWDLTPVASGADGSYTLGAIPSPPTNPYKLTISQSGFITRELWVGWQIGARNDVTLDLIRDAPPFSLEFYRQFVRGTYDHSDAPYATKRWTTSPKFYVKTVDQAGKPIEPEVLSVVRDAIARAVSSYSAGKLTAAAIDTGTEVRPDAAGWISVDIQRTNDPLVCGRAFVGSDPGLIILYDDVCSCGSRKIPGSVVMHEVGHALGFYHVADTNSVMYPFAPGNCPPGDLSAAEKYHAAIAYSRPAGNVDPDNDPSSGKLLTPESLRRILVIN